PDRSRAPARLPAGGRLRPRHGLGRRRAPLHRSEVARGKELRMSSMAMPYEGPLVSREPGPRQIPEPPRRGEPGGPPCAICRGKTTSAVWSDDNWTLHPPVGGSLLGAVWLASRVHVDSFRDLPPELQREFGVVAARIEDAILSLGDIGRVHLYRCGDGGAHFHVWFIPRPLGMLEASGMMLPLWEDVLPNVTDEELADAARRVAAAM